MLIFSCMCASAGIRELRSANLAKNDTQCTDETDSSIMRNLLLFCGVRSKKQQEAAVRAQRQTEPLWKKQSEIATVLFRL